MTRDADLDRALFDFEREWEDLPSGVVVLVARKGEHGHMVDYTCRAKPEDLSALMKAAPVRTEPEPQAGKKTRYRELRRTR